MFCYWTVHGITTRKESLITLLVNYNVFTNKWQLHKILTVAVMNPSSQCGVVIPQPYASRLLQIEGLA